MWKPGMLAKCISKSWYRHNNHSRLDKLHMRIQPGWKPPIGGPAYGEICTISGHYIDADGTWLWIRGYEHYGAYEPRYFVPLQDQLTEDLERIEKEGAPAEPEPQPQHEH